MNAGPRDQHSLENVAALVEYSKRDDLELEKQLRVADRLMKHGHVAAGAVMDQCARTIECAPDDAARAVAMMRLDQTRAAHAVIRRCFRFEDMTSERAELFYRASGPIFLRRARCPSLLVLFGTIANSFGVSFAVATALLRQLECSLLILKDGFSGFYRRGVPGFAGSFSQIPASIEALARKEGIESIFVTGYSSGTYAALPVSISVNANGYLGFCQYVESESDADHRGQREGLNRALGIGNDIPTDLRPMLRDADPLVPRTIYYGERDARDVAQARHIADLGTVNVVALPDVGHNLIPPLIASGAFTDVFANMMRAATRPINRVVFSSLQQ